MNTGTSETMMKVTPTTVRKTFTISDWKYTFSGNKRSTWGDLEIYQKGGGGFEIGRGVIRMYSVYYYPLITYTLIISLWACIIWCLTAAFGLCPDSAD
jgi:hypothetical protein